MKWCPGGLRSGQCETGGDVEPGYPIRRRLGHRGAHVGAEVAAVDAVPLGAEPAHQFHPHPADALGAPSGCGSRGSLRS
ncbi:hypothetical protein C5E45_05870 [Nocardia nova]|uniref:Uncharacterized protein n=1 Tax=Nocardia nova TaxID=37330 RepID=A0A2S6AV08_9NOCA|nr:hypothetical protein C5E45_05870 [Nocardia nova]